MTEWFAARGHTVAGCGRDGAAIVDLHQRLGEPHHFAALDVTDDGAVAAWAREVLVDVGTPDYILNNAALMNRPAPLWELKEEEFNPVIDVNIKGVANVIRHFMPALLAKRNGVIVNFSSGWGRGTSPEVAPYCATKFAIEGLTQALAQELPRGLAAVSLNPGVIDTDMLRTSWGNGAGSYPKPEAWVRKAGPFILGIKAQDNGKSMTVR
jgi:NAD(P)-dependent dehydrogenase (short-subunit alcohol dehydrogenase family)